MDLELSLIHKRHRISLRSKQSSVEQNFRDSNSTSNIAQAQCRDLSVVRPLIVRVMFLSWIEAIWSVREVGSRSDSARFEAYETAWELTSVIPVVCEEQIAKCVRRTPGLEIAAAKGFELRSANPSALCHLHCANEVRPSSSKVKRARHQHTSDAHLLSSRADDPLLCSGQR